ncbi:MAG: hypothetical protein PHN74_02560 [Candidatus Pacebacteria bacterium]|nr:hypothetical protein [Candidatus Paceibacterota bacterium]
MNTSQTYILIAIVALAIIGAVMFFVRKKEQRPISKMAAIAFAFIIAGIAFGENRLIGYGLMGIGVIFALVDIVKKFKK